jgi:hypothetical protein
MTVSEAMETLTGFDEIAVEKTFGIDFYAGNESHPLRPVRAMVFVLKRREGMSDNDAKDFALGLTAKDLNEFFEDEPDEVMPEEPVTEAGKEPSMPEPEPENSPPSAF